MSALPEPIPAATLVLMRPSRTGGAPELLLMERPDTMAFAAGALVFPGGRIEPDDHVTAARFALKAADAPARIAAIRETIEEAGLALGLSPAPDQALLEVLRRELSAGTAFSALLDHHGIAVDPGTLTPFARWCPNFKETRRFDTMFFLAEAPSDAPRATADENEAVRLLWASAAQVLADADAGRVHIIFPTRRNLERLTQFASVDEARADATRHPVEKITPWVEERDGEKWVCIPEGIGYPVTAERLATARRR